MEKNTKILLIFNAVGVVTALTLGYSVFAEYKNRPLDGMFKLSDIDEETAKYYVSLGKYIDPALEEYILLTEKEMKEMFPDVKFNSSIDFYLVVNKVKDFQYIDKITGELIERGVAGITSTHHRIILIEKDNLDAVSHEKIHEMLGIRSSHTITEGLTAYLDKILFDKNSYFVERIYIEALTEFIPLEDLVKLVAEGKEKNINKLLSKYFDVDILKLMDESCGFEGNEKTNTYSETKSVEVKKHLVNAYFVKLEEYNIDLTIPENEEKYNLYLGNIGGFVVKVKVGPKEYVYELTELGEYAQAKKEEYISSYKLRKTPREKTNDKAIDKNIIREILIEHYFLELEKSNIDLSIMSNKMQLERFKKSIGGFDKLTKKSDGTITIKDTKLGKYANELETAYIAKYNFEIFYVSSGARL